MFLFVLPLFTLEIAVHGLHSGLGLLLNGRIAKYPCAIRSKLRFISIDSIFGFMIDRKQRINVICGAVFPLFRNRNINLISQLLHILFQAVCRYFAHGNTPYTL